MTETIFTPHNSFSNNSNVTEVAVIDSISATSQMEQVVMILSTIIASVGIIANFTVILVFLNDKKRRQKIPNIFIIHQVRVMLVQLVLYHYRYL